MDCEKVGKLILQLRTERGLTQKNVADALGISNKTVSKWECGLGCPDLSLWPELSVILGADMAQLMEGEITQNRPDSGNISRVRFYVCPVCGNVLFSTGSATIHCCGRRVEPLKPQTEHAPSITVEEMDTDYYVSFDHPMEKTHYLVFAAYVKVTGSPCIGSTLSRMGRSAFLCSGAESCMSIAAVTGCSAIKNPFENDSATEVTILRRRCIYFSFFSTTHTRIASTIQRMSKTTGRPMLSQGEPAV